MEALIARLYCNTRIYGSSKCSYLFLDDWNELSTFVMSYSFAVANYKVDCLRKIHHCHRHRLSIKIFFFSFKYWMKRWILLKLQNPWKFHQNYHFLFLWNFFYVYMNWKNPRSKIYSLLFVDYTYELFEAQKEIAKIIF